MERRDSEALDRHITGNYGEDSAGNDESTIRIAPRVHHYHHTEATPPHVSVDMEHNSRGVTWGVHVSGAESIAQAMELLDKARDEMSHRFGSVSEVK